MKERRLMRVGRTCVGWLEGDVIVRSFWNGCGVAVREEIPLPAGVKGADVQDWNPEMPSVFVRSSYHVYLAGEHRWALASGDVFALPPPAPPKRGPRELICEGTTLTQRAEPRVRVVVNRPLAFGLSGCAEPGDGVTLPKSLARELVGSGRAKPADKESEKLLVSGGVLTLGGMR